MPTLHWVGKDKVVNHHLDVPYILASLADKTSAVDVEQILGRVLRMPHVQQHSHDLLNLSYVFTASNRFMDTLQSVLKGLNRAGFTDKDFRAVEPESPAVVPDGGTSVQPMSLNLFDALPKAADQEDDDLDSGSTAPDWQAADQRPEGGDAAAATTTGAVYPAASFVEQLKVQAQAENEAFEAKAQAAEDGVTPELENKMNRHRLKDLFREEAMNLALPQFFIKIQNAGFFDADQPFQTFEREELLKDFRLSQGDATITFDDVETEMYRVDLEQLDDENYAPKAFKLAVNERARFTAYLLILPPESQMANLVTRLTELIGNMYPISDPEVKAYVRRIVADMSADQVRDCIERDVAYVRKIKQKITTLADAHALKTFTELLDVDRITIQPGFKLPESITPNANASSVPKSLYVTEAAMGDFERRLINDIANLESVKWCPRSSTAALTNCCPRTGSHSAVEQIGLRLRLRPTALGMTPTRMCFAFVGGVGRTLTMDRLALRLDMALQQLGSAQGFIARPLHQAIGSGRVEFARGAAARLVVQARHA